MLTAMGKEAASLMQERWRILKKGQHVGLGEKRSGWSLRGLHSPLALVTTWATLPEATPLERSVARSALGSAPFQSRQLLVLENLPH